MCGIAGIFNQSTSSAIERDQLHRMIALLNHRGPDECGSYFDDVIGLGHARLSIIGLEDGIQPLCNEDGSLWIVYNGEIFNYVELRQQLIKRNHRFQTHTDTEVLLHLYEEFGPGFLDKVIGQFALAIWNRRTNELFLARDPVGIRPLYYCHSGGRFLFASEIKALFSVPGVTRKIDPLSLCDTFHFWSPVTPQTAFEGVYELPPGSYATLKPGGPLKHTTYWDVPVYAAEERWSGSFSDAVDALKDVMKDAVRLCLRADVPVGAYLSGGLDSSILTALIAGHFNNRLRTFSLSFEEDQFDESAFQRDLVQYLGTDHLRAEVSNPQIRDHFAETVWHCEKPLLRTAPVPMLLLAERVQQSRFKVVLTGEGADELFGGYNIFKEAKIRRFWGQEPTSTWRPRLVEKLYPYIFNNQATARLFLQQFFAVTSEQLDDPLFSHQIRWKNSGKNRLFFSSEVQQQLQTYNPLGKVIAALPSGFESWDSFAKTQYLEMNYFLSSYLLSSQGDRVGMARSIEQRHPFLDRRVIDFAARLPDRFKLKGLNEKYILKKAFHTDVPESVWKRDKQPYRAPIRDVFFGTKEGVAETLLSESAIAGTGYFDPDKVKRLVQRFSQEGAGVSSETQNMALVGILSTQLLHEQFITTCPKPATGDIQPRITICKRGENYGC